MTDDRFIPKGEQPGSLSRLAEAAKSTFWGHVGCEVVRAEAGKTVISLHVQPHHLNLMGIVHGGVVTTLLDNAMGLAVMLLHPSGKTVTAQMNVHFLKSASGGMLTCEADLIHESRRTLTLQGRVIDEDGELLAWGSGSFRRVT
jgi:uncharacterized protein (TIGR00369 family)